MATYSGPAPLSAHVQSTVTVGDSQATTAAVGGLDVEGKLIAWVDDGKPAVAEIGVGRAEDTQAGVGARFFGGRSRGDLGAMTAVHSGDNVLDIIAVGHDGTDFAQCARIDMEATGVIAAGQVPGRVRVRTANAAGSLQDVAVFDHQGRLGLQTLSPDGVLDATPDSISASSYSYPTRVTGAQRAALVGMVAGATVYDTDAGAYYVHDGANWAALGGAGASAKEVGAFTLSADQVSPAAGATVAFDGRSMGTLALNAGAHTVTLKAGKIYRITANIGALFTGTSYNWIEVKLRDVTNGVDLAFGAVSSPNRSSGAAFSPLDTFVEVGAADVDISLMVSAIGGTLGRIYATAYSGSGVGHTKLLIQEV